MEGEIDEISSKNNKSKIKMGLVVSVSVLFLDQILLHTWIKFFISTCSSRFECDNQISSLGYRDFLIQMFQLSVVNPILASRGFNLNVLRFQIYNTF